MAQEHLREPHTAPGRRAQTGVRLGLAGLVLLASPALAHAFGVAEGLALYFAAIAWVVALPVCIVVEALVYALLFKLWWVRAVATSLAANVVSFVAGAVAVLALGPSWYGDIPPLAYLVIPAAAALDVTIAVLMSLDAPDRRRMPVMAGLANLISTVVTIAIGLAVWG